MRDELAALVQGADLPEEWPEGSQAGWFAKPSEDLDPRVVDPDTGKLRRDLRVSLIGILDDFWGTRYRDHRSWSTLWLAGSALAWQWEGRGEPDLDMLIGVNVSKFRQANPEWGKVPEHDLAAHFNGEFDRDLEPHTSNLFGGWEVTWYVNPGGSDIRDINPYAAYDLTHDEWTVEPVEVDANWDPSTMIEPSWWRPVKEEIEKARGLARAIYEARSDLQRPATDPRRLNALVTIQNAVLEAERLFVDIHAGRRNAFSKGGKGYYDYFNFRWQAHKRYGTIKILHTLKQLRGQASKLHETKTYGSPLVDPQKLRSEVVNKPVVDWYRKKLG